MIKIQTFLPYDNFEKCASVLDDKRLYKQIVECKQILNTLKLIKEGKIYIEIPEADLTQRIPTNDIHRASYNSNGETRKIAWLNHPIVKMWKGYEKALRYYQWCMFQEWAERRWGFIVYEADFITTRGNYEGGYEHYTDFPKYLFPKWLGNKELHLSHQSNLLRKNRKHYGKYFGDIPDNLPYVWIGGD